jgi:Carbohydrate/starch-binding module (family 21)
MNGAVRLKLGRREFFSGGGFSGSFAPISVKVKNIAFSKDVAVHYTPDGNSWKDFPLSFSSHFGDYDIFSGTVNEQVTQFVIRYTAGGGTFFDNNTGQNYHLDSTLAAVGGNVILNNARARQGVQAGGGFTFVTSWLEGEILVNNLSFAKDVGVRASVDGGINWHDTHGSFAGQNTGDSVFVGAGAEVWRFKTPELNLDSSSNEFRFAVFYRNVATGEVFWDNNFGQDYKVSKADGTMIG